MSNKPTTVPDWTPSGADVVTPAAGEKTAGFQGGQRPPAQYINWFWELITQWVVWLANGVLQRSSLSDNSPVFSSSDRDGRLRNYFDPNGYLFGPAIQATYEAVGEGNQAGSISFVAFNAGRLRASADVNCEVGEDFISGQNSGALQLTILDAAAATQGAIIHRSESHRNIDDLIAVTESRVQLNTVGASAVDVWFGFSSSSVRAVPSSSSDHAAFVKKSTDTNWQAQVAETATSITTTDTTIPPVASTLQTLRIEYHGLNTPLGVDNSGPVVRFFIAGALVHEDTGANVPVGSSQLFLVAGAAAVSPGPSADFEMDLCTIKYAYNEVLAGDIPV